MTSSAPLQQLLRPRTIAVIGGREAAEVIRQCDRIGFTGTLWPVNPHRDEIAGRPCLPSVADLPAAPDAAFVAVPREKTIAAVADLAALGAGGVVCYASGFAEIGGDGIALQKQLAAAAGEMPFLGPNCYGLLNYLDGVALWPDQHGGERVARGAAVVLQSGNIGINLTMHGRDLPLAYLLSTGNQAGLPLHLALDGLLADERVAAIGFIVEGLADPAAFSRAACRALEQGVPLVALKLGGSDRGRELALSHTRSLTGSDALYDALFDRFGVAQTQTLPQFVETLKLLTLLGPLPGEQIASISCSGGEAALAADLADRHDLPFPRLTAGQAAGLRAVLGPTVPLNNPLDYHTYIWGNEPAQAACFAAMLQGEQDITLKILDFPRPDRCSDDFWYAAARAFGRALRETGRRGVVVSTLPENLPPAARAFLREQGIPPMQGLEECLVAIRGAALVGRRQAGKAAVQPLPAYPTLAQTAENTLDEARSKALLARAGLPVPAGTVCTAAGAPAAAAALGFPVVLKILSSEITHKTDAGGVALDLRTPEAVAAAAAAMRHLGDRFLVETQLPTPAAELLVGLTREDPFGPVLVLAGGGVLVELLRDRITLLLPVSRTAVEAALDRLQIAPLLAGYRGRPPADRKALVEAILALARFGETHAGHLLEVDVNPLFARPAGQGVVAVDAVIRTRGELPDV